MDPKKAQQIIQNHRQYVLDKKEEKRKKFEKDIQDMIDIVNVELEDPEKIFNTEGGGDYRRRLESDTNRLSRAESERLAEYYKAGFGDDNVELDSSCRNERDCGPICYCRSILIIHIKH